MFWFLLGDGTTPTRGNEENIYFIWKKQQPNFHLWELETSQKTKLQLCRKKLLTEQTVVKSWHLINDLQLWQKYNNQYGEISIFSQKSDAVSIVDYFWKFLKVSMHASKQVI